LVHTHIQQDKDQKSSVSRFQSPTSAPVVYAREKDQKREKPKPISKIQASILQNKNQENDSKAGPSSSTQAYREIKPSKVSPRADDEAFEEIIPQKRMQNSTSQKAIIPLIKNPVYTFNKHQDNEQEYADAPYMHQLVASAYKQITDKLANTRCTINSDNSDIIDQTTGKPTDNCIKDALEYYFADKTDREDELRYLYQYLEVERRNSYSKACNHQLYIIHLMALTNITQSDEANFEADNKKCDEAYGESMQKLAEQKANKLIHINEVLTVKADQIETKKDKKRFAKSDTCWICKEKIAIDKKKVK
ncbi:13122_t:CDS:2, partial [Cetraspora pellucida]